MNQENRDLKEIYHQEKNNCYRKLYCFTPKITQDYRLLFLNISDTDLKGVRTHTDKLLTISIKFKFEILNSLPK